MINRQLHPRLSLNAITSPGRSFEADVDFWTRAGLRCVGLLEPKLAAFGYDAAIDLIRERRFAVSTLICGSFTLLEPDRWVQERAKLKQAIDIAAEVGGTVYGVPGAGAFDDWDGNAARYAEAISPCLDHARKVGVTLAFEPTLRPYLSFVHNLRDSLDLAKRSGSRIVVDVGNCYNERDVLHWIRRLGGHIGLVQVSDVAVGTIEQPGAGTRTNPGEGDLPLSRFVTAALQAGYTGAFEIEYLGPAETNEAAVINGLLVMDAILRDVVSA